MVEGNLEQKQRVNLSSFARSVIENDYQLFSGDGSYSGFFNRLISNFAPQAEASVDEAVAQRREALSAQVEEGVLQAILEQYRRELLRKQEAWPQGDSITFRLNKENFSLLYLRRMESRNYSAPSKYLKALLEEYARLSPADREKVYFLREVEEVILPAIAGGYPLKVKVSAKEFLVRPYAVTADAYGAHLYLIGYSRRPEETAEQIASFRISRLEGLQLGKRSAKQKISRDEAREVENKLRRTGVQYLVGEVETIRLRLTPAGQQDFAQRSYMRPNPDSISPDGIYCFSCTQRQIQNYFFSFGSQVEILEPESLRQTFRQNYAQALALYG